MQKIKLLILVILCIFVLTGCNNNTNDNIVKAVGIKYDNYKEYTVTVYMYDLSAEKEKFKTDVLTGTDISNLLLQAVYDYDYNLKMCEYFVVDKPTLVENANNLFYTLNSLKFNQNVKLICGDLTENMLNNLIKENYDTNFLYNIKLNKTKITDLVAIVDEQANAIGGVIISNGGYAGEVDKEEWNILQMFEGNKEFNYRFFNEQYIAKLTNAKINYYHKNDNLIIDIQAQVNGYRGIGSSIDEKELFYSLLENDMKNKIYSILNDYSLTSILNLNWYEKQTGYTLENTILNVNLS